MSRHIFQTWEHANAEPSESGLNDSDDPGPSIRLLDLVGQPQAPSACRGQQTLGGIPVRSTKLNAVAKGCDNPTVRLAGQDGQGVCLKDWLL